ncbi:binding-protein-dependent transport systems inner membrane component [Xylanimonas cellulosilytica DSM 15894]|uniref:Binding-protein-dependent transport systems inner membrane component n=1 Tax=Xylanimonas cellulosilytica (strain DSM 15894 / JCM 12276 / CECT 5975 / KCTC 9989 / LMG 20990 / NBRC 107835 / XIL07) TaxID=446471 RepID=D1BVJ1_XYLCX|nr:ABC transporter permease [Xylanimonas cellulosilytica]ACZ29462.1 binding-protein-dependent transport systems inner membrane component [Xylanimonas cellulosilytica DSM 15894]
MSAPPAPAPPARPPRTDGVPADGSVRVGVDDRFHRAPSRPAGLQRVTQVAGRAIGPLFVLALWWVASAQAWVSPILLPAPGTVWAAAVDLVSSGKLQDNLGVSLGRAMTGLGIGLVVGVTLALLTGLSKVAELLVDSNVQMVRSMPILALQPLVIVWFGIGEPTKILLVALAVTFPVYINTHAAIRAVDARFVELATTRGLGRLALVRHVVLPGALPGFLTGLRFATSISWLVLVVAEQINATAGIGYLMTQARTVARTDVIIVGLVVYALLGLLSDTIVRLVQRKALSWSSTLQAR